MCKGILWNRLGDTVVDQAGPKAAKGRGENFSFEDITESIQGLGEVYIFEDEL
jgi:hypothetical protein